MLFIVINKTYDFLGDASVWIVVSVGALPFCWSYRGPAQLFQGMQGIPFSRGALGTLYWPAAFVFKAIGAVLWAHMTLQIPNTGSHDMHQAGATLARALALISAVVMCSSLPTLRW